jgi:hypothetical protein
MGFDVSDELIFFGRIEVPKRDNNCLVVVAAHFDGASCGLTVYGLDAVAFGSEPVVHFFFEVSKAFRFARGEQLKLGRHGHSYMPWATSEAPVFFRQLVPERRTGIVTVCQENGTIHETKVVQNF